MHAGCGSGMVESKGPASIYSPLSPPLVGATGTPGVFTGEALGALAEVNRRLASGSVFPKLANIRDVSIRIAAALGRLASEAGAFAYDGTRDLETFVRERMYDPVYSPAE